MKYDDGNETFADESEREKFVANPGRSADEHRGRETFW